LSLYIGESGFFAEEPRIVENGRGHGVSPMPTKLSLAVG
jgi:hypothetical protein